MVQFFQLGPKRRGVLNEALGESLGKGLSNFTNEYYANKALQGVLQDKSLENAPYSEKIQRLHTALGMHGEAGQRQLTGALAAAQVKQGENMFKKAKQVAANPKSTPSEILFSLVEAGQGVPGSERYIAQAFDSLMAQKNTEVGADIPFSPDQQTQGVPGAPGAPTAPPATQQGAAQMGIQQPGTQFPAFATSQKALDTQKFYPTNVGPQEPVGQAPQEASQGVKRPILNADQLMNDAQRLQREYANRGFPIDNATALAQAKARNDENMLHNQLIDQETAARVQTQQRYGQIAKEKLLNLFPTATDEQQAYFAKKGEDIAKRSKSEADVERFLANEARDFKRTLENVRKEIPAARTYNKPLQNLMGEGKSFEQARADLRLKLKPLLDAGLYDTARLELSKLGYYPEERERIISNLSESVEKNLADFGKIKPQLKKGLSVQEPTEIPYFEKARFRNNLEKTLLADPNANLVLLRKEYEDRGIDWRTFKDTLNQLESSGKFKPNGDQLNQVDKLDTPPLNTLEKFLHKVGFSGR